MKLTILGSGCAWTKRGCASYLLNNNIMVDPGFGSIKQLLKSDDKLLHHEKIERIDLILITHFHSDHFFDIPYILQKCAIGKYADQKLVIISPPGGKEKIQQLCRLGLGDRQYNKINFDEYCVFYEAEERKTFYFRDLEITSIELDHYDTPNFGYMIKEPTGRVISFSGDTVMTDNVIYMADNSDVFVLDMANSKKEKSHYNIVEGIELMKKYRGKCCIIPAHLTSQAIDYCRDKILIPYDLMVMDTDDELPYDYEIKNKQHFFDIDENFAFNVIGFNYLKNKDIILRLNETRMPDMEREISPTYIFDVLNDTKQQIGKLEYRVGNSIYTEYNGSVSFEFDETVTPKMMEQCFELLKQIARYHKQRVIYYAARTDDMGMRKLFEKIGASLKGIRYITTDEEREIVNNGDVEHCIYELRLDLDDDDE